MAWYISLFILQLPAYMHNSQYEYYNEPSLLWDTKQVQEGNFQEYTWDDIVETQDIDADKLLNYHVDAESNYDDDKPLNFSERILNVNWHGCTYWPSTSLLPAAGMASMTLKHSSAQGDVQYFTAAGRANRHNFTIAGECRAGDELCTVSLSFQRSFNPVARTQYFTGTWTAATDTLTGTVGFDANPTKQKAAFVFKRTAPEFMTFWPPPAELSAKRARALWVFAIAAVKYTVGKDRWSWSFFEERRHNRRRFIKLYIRSNGSSTKFGAPLTSLEGRELGLLKKTFSTADSRFYHSLAEQQIRTMPNHIAGCDACGGGTIGGERIICLVCQTKEMFDTVDLCTSTEDCIGQRVMRDDMEKPHLPHHDLMKVRRAMHVCQFGKTYRDGKEALKYARTFFESPTGEGLTDSESEADTDDEEGPAPSVQRLSPIPALDISIPQTQARTADPKSAGSTAQPLSQMPHPCAGETFICWECDSRPETSFGKHDIHEHDLVRVTELIEEGDLSTEERLKAMDERISKLDDGFSKLAKQYAGLEAAVDARMVRVEQLLNQILARLGTSGQ
ncbi:hypothetical protein B0H17DRAFT_1222744 [Mycena rosella]|uniref:Uncharacterized protein n=1 Tax=Mycena rosella TaxID=1033263 RepID=A0AAD7AX38_MYCRO|nr:hypothetical protein B0H17DRAFT_1222744 [Mycena rosella]